MGTRRHGAVVLAFAILAASCSSAGGVALPAPGAPDQRSAPASVAPTPSPTRTPSTEPTPAPPTPVPATPAAPATPTPTPEPAWSVDISAIDAEVRSRIEPTSWREGCPVSLEDLRLLTFPYVNFEGAVAMGELIISAEWADDVAGVFERLFEAEYPIEGIELIDQFGGDDQLSMNANNTSGFNCREVASRPGVWSNHAFGTAIDLNPLLNPYVRGSFVDPEAGAPYADRSDVRFGMIVPGDAAVRAFEEIGWVWGGNWSNLKDYQHFSANGR